MAAEKKSKKKGQKGKTRSKLTLSERRLRAAELFGRGYTDTDVARELDVSRNTAAAYRKAWKESIQEEVRDDPSAFRDVLGNTLRMLAELDQVRKVAWQALERKLGVLRVTCPSCEEEIEYTYRYPPTDQAQTQYLNLLTKTAEQRAKLYGLMGVKQEVFIEIQNVNFVQQRIMAWLGDNLNGPQREALAEFIETELAGYVGESEESRRTPVLDATAVEGIVGEPVPIPA